MKTFRQLAVLGAGSALLLATPALAQDDDRVELTMFYPVAVGGPLTDVVDGMVEEFEEEHPDIRIEAVYAGNYDDTRVRALSALESGDPPQLSVLFSIDLFELIDQDVIMPFDDVVETEEEREWLDSFYPALMENGQLDGKTYGVPFQRSTIVLYWNKDLFREAGLDPDQPPETWEEMVEMGREIREATDEESWG